MDIRKVKKLIELLEESGIAEIEIKEGEESVRISRLPTGGAVTQVPMYAPPALAAASVGIAMGARGAAASSEAADAVVLVDRLDRVARAIRIARRTLHIARQSVAAGIGLSAAGMVAAALGYLTPVEGALLQEAIDVAVILNALRALRGDEDGAIKAAGTGDVP